MGARHRLAKAATSMTERAIKMVEEAPRITANNIQENFGAFTRPYQVSKVNNRCGKGQRELSGAAKPPLGWIFGDFYRPWQRRFPMEPYNKDIHNRREYPPLSLLELQRLIDLGWINVNEPIDLTTLCNTFLYRCDPEQRQFGVQLTDEGADAFEAQVNIEVQWASELAIACIERNGGVIRAAYYDPASLVAVVNPAKFFRKAQPIPKRAYPPLDLVERYTDPKQRGYLADEGEIAEEREILGQKYGYPVPDTQDSPKNDLLKMQKDPLQVFYGLKSGWVVNMPDRTILKPTDPELVEYYNLA